MIWDRERYIAHCNFEFTGRELFCQLFGPIHGLAEEWRRQGATEEEISMIAFDWDYVLRKNLSANTGAVTGIEPMILSDNAEERLSIDHMGRHVRMCKSTALRDMPLDYPVRTMDDWMKIKHWYTFSEDRINIEALRQERKLRDKGYLTVLRMPGGFDEPRQLMGEENACLVCYDDPELLTDILETIGNTCVEVIQRVSEIVPIDYLYVHEDMAGKSGPLWGPNQIREFVMPYYRKVWDCARAHGTTQFGQDSDGNMNAVMDVFLECGLNNMHPFEPAAGMDMVKMREKYGKTVCLKGGIDKMVLREDFTAIRNELEYKMNPSMLGGGTIFGLDHMIPNGVSIENYRYYVKLGREILGLPQATGKGWQNMAF